MFAACHGVLLTGQVVLKSGGWAQQQVTVTCTFHVAMSVRSHTWRPRGVRHHGQVPQEHLITTHAKNAGRHYINSARQPQDGGPLGCSTVPPCPPAVVDSAPRPRCRSQSAVRPVWLPRAYQQSRPEHYDIKRFITRWSRQSTDQSRTCRDCSRGGPARETCKTSISQPQAPTHS